MAHFYSNNMLKKSYCDFEVNHIQDPHFPVTVCLKLMSILSNVWQIHKDQSNKSVNNCTFKCLSGLTNDTNLKGVLNRFDLLRKMYFLFI